MVITRKLKYDTPRLSMGGVDIGMSKEIKLLGLTIDSKLTFNSHIANVCKKAIGVQKQLTRAAKVSWGLHPEVIRIIYLATVEPIIMYAASAWASAASKIGVIKHLNAVQRGFAQKLCRAYRTVSLNSALVLAGILPLDLRIREAALLYEARRGVSLPELGDKDVERMSPAIEAPHPAHQEYLEFKTLIDQEQFDANSDYAMQIFTDGSKIDGKVGAALSLWNGETETKAIKLSLPSFCTVYQAELLAICNATREILRRKESTFAIYSDSMAALETVTGLHCLHPLAVETRENIRTLSQQNKIINLFWIKAHAGLLGNERADQLAKEAALKLKTKPNYDKCPVSFVKRIIRMRTLDEWNRRYVAGDTASVTKLFLPNATVAYEIVRKIECNGLLTTIMTGHGALSEYLNRFKCKESPSCICEPNAIETIPHILSDCPKYSAERYNIEQELGCRMVPENFSQIMSGKNRNIFLRYCKNIASNVIIRNKTA